MGLDEVGDVVDGIIDCDVARGLAVVRFDLCAGERGQGKGRHGCCVCRGCGDVLVDVGGRGIRAGKEPVEEYGRSWVNEEEATVENTGGWTNGGVDRSRGLYLAGWRDGRMVIIRFLGRLRGDRMRFRHLERPRGATWFGLGL